MRVLPVSQIHPAKIQRGSAHLRAIAIGDAAKRAHAPSRAHVLRDFLRDGCSRVEGAGGFGVASAEIGPKVLVLNQDE